MPPRKCHAHGLPKQAAASTRGDGANSEESAGHEGHALPKPDEKESDQSAGPAEKIPQQELERLYEGENDRNTLLESEKAVCAATVARSKHALEELTTQYREIDKAYQDCKTELERESQREAESLRAIQDASQGLAQKAHERYEAAVAQIAALTEEHAAAIAREKSAKAQLEQARLDILQEFEDARAEQEAREKSALAREQAALERAAELREKIAAAEGLSSTTSGYQGKKSQSMPILEEDTVPQSSGSLFSGSTARGSNTTQETSASRQSASLLKRMIGSIRRVSLFGDAAGQGGKRSSTREGNKTTEAGCSSPTSLESLPESKAGDSPVVKLASLQSGSELRGVRSVDSTGVRSDSSSLFGTTRYSNRTGTKGSLNSKGQRSGKRDSARQSLGAKLRMSIQGAASKLASGRRKTVSEADVSMSTMTPVPPAGARSQTLDLAR